MKAYILILTMSLIVTVSTFCAVDAWQECEPKPVQYIEQLVRWVGGIE